MRFQTLNDKISELTKCSKKLGSPADQVRALSAAAEVANEIIKILNPGAIELKYGEDALEDIISSNNFKNYKVEGWFSFHPIYPDERLALRFYESNLCEVKFYWLNDNSTKSRISAGVMLTPNWEDRETTENDDYRVGIDFFLKKDASALLMVISQRGNLRVMEFSERLTHTQVEILEKIAGSLTLSSKRAFHETLWNALALSEVNRKFYEGVAKQFTILYQHLVSLGKDKDDAKIFSSRLLGRLLFIWFLRKKGVVPKEEKYFPRDIEDSTKYYNSVLKPLFFKTFNTPIYDRKSGDTETPYLNGGLFEPHDNDWQFEETSFPSNYFNDLYEHLDKYNFTTDESSPDYEQVAIDPEMLGRVFESLLAEQRTDTGEQARKAKGAFYTPREIVSYMCKESLRQYLYTQLGDEKYYAGVDKLLDSPDYEWETAHSNAKRDLWPFEDMIKITHRVEAILDSFKVLDPACGSGAFPMGMLQLLARTYERLDSRLNPYNTKLSIIQNNIFGVDIEPMAVEISRLRAWLAIIVDDEGKIDPLPNLDFKFVCADSLIPLETSRSLWSDPNLQEKMANIREKFFNARKPEMKEKWKKEYYKLATPQADIFGDKRDAQLKSFDPFKNQHPASFFDAKYMFGVEDFDAVIGNPPYVSTKGVLNESKKTYEHVYGFSDDLYNIFTFRGMNLLRPLGTLSFITPKTFWTTQTKRNMRDLLLDNTICYIFDTANPFESALVDTCITQVKKLLSSDETTCIFIDGSKSISDPYIFKPVKQNIYKHTQNHVLFKPTEQNLEIWEKYGSKISSLFDKWWGLIKTSKDIEKNKEILKRYRESLKPGDIALLGCLTEGGQGLATANNGKYIAVRNSTKWADQIRISRPKKIKEAIARNKSMALELGGMTPESFLRDKNEKEIADFFDRMKEKYGRDIFGQGYIYRIITDDEMANVDELTMDERENGIDSTKKIYVPYEKGDKDGNRWYLETPFAIAWSKDNVRYLKTDKKARYQGYQFFFREGFCWNNVLLPTQEEGKRIKTRVKSNAVNDVASMSLYSIDEYLTPNYYLITLLCSRYFYNYLKTFINNTVNLQINDFRLFPIIIPNDMVLKDAKVLFDEAISARKNSNNEHLMVIEKEVDQFVEKLYAI